MKILLRSTYCNRAYHYLKQKQGMRFLIFRRVEGDCSGNEQELTDKKVLIMKPVPGIEDLFSTIDFKKYILHKRVGITESNLEYIANNKISRNDLAAAFCIGCLRCCGQSKAGKVHRQIPVVQASG